MSVPVMKYFAGVLTASLLVASCDGPVYEVDRFQPRIRQNPSEADRQFNEGIARSVLQQWPEAAASFAQAVSLNPEDGQAWFRLGLAYCSQNRFDAAKQAFDQAYALDDSFGASRQQMSMVYRALGDREREMLALKAAVEEGDPHPVYLRYRLGLVYSGLNRDDDAIAALNEAVRYDASAAGQYGVYHILGAIYQNHEDWADAAAMYEEQTRHPSFAQVKASHFNLGVVYHQIPDYPRAIEAFSGAVRLDPQDASALYNLAASYLLAEQPDAVPPLLDRLRALSPEYAADLEQLMQNFRD